MIPKPLSLISSKKPLNKDDIHAIALGMLADLGFDLSGNNMQTITITEKDVKRNPDKVAAQLGIIDPHKLQPRGFDPVSGKSLIAGDYRDHNQRTRPREYLATEKDACRYSRSHSKATSTKRNCTLGDQTGAHKITIKNDDTIKK